MELRYDTIDVNQETVVEYASLCYSNPNRMVWSEFKSDFASFSRLKRMLTKISRGNKIDDHFLGNMIVMQTNLFGVYPTAKITIVLLSQNPSALSIWATYFDFLQYGFHEPIRSIGGKSLSFHEIPLDQTIYNVLTRVRK